MRKFLTLGVMVFVLHARADVIKASKMTRDGSLERSYVLKTNLREKVVIDCQSFIQGLRIGEYASAHTYLLDEQECTGLQGRIRSSISKRQSHCIDVDSDIRADYSCY